MLVDHLMSVEISLYFACFNANRWVNYALSQTSDGPSGVDTVLIVNALDL